MPCSMFAALVKSARHRRRRPSTCAPASIRSAAWPQRRGSPKPWSELSKAFAGMIARTRRARLSRAVRGRRRPHHPQCRRLGSAGTRLRARQRGRLSARARGRRRRARCGARHDLFPARRRRRRIPHHRQIPRAAKTLGARRAGLRTGAQAGLRRRRNRVADDDAARSLREHAAHDDRDRRRRPRRRRQHQVLPFTAALGLPDASRAGSRATRSSSCWKNPISRRSPTRPRAPAPSRS